MEQTLEKDSLVNPPPFPKTNKGPFCFSEIVFQSMSTLHTKVDDWMFIFILFLLFFFLFYFLVLIMITGTGLPFNELLLCPGTWADEDFT